MGLSEDGYYPLLGGENGVPLEKPALSRRRVQWTIYSMIVLNILWSVGNILPLLWSKGGHLFSRTIASSLLLQLG